MYQLTHSHHLDTQSGFVANAKHLKLTLPSLEEGSCSVWFIKKQVGKLFHACVQKYLQGEKPEYQTVP